MRRKEIFSMLFLASLLAFSVDHSGCSGGGSGGGNDTDDTDGDGGGAGSGNTACGFEVGASLYDGTGTSGNGESTRTTDNAELIQPADLAYLGAFRLPGGEDRDEGTFGYGGNAMTYYPPNNSLFISGHDRIVSDFPSGSRIAEVSIPSVDDLVISDNVELLPQSSFIQEFADVTGGLFDTYEEIPRMGMSFIDTEELEETLFLAFGQHFHESDEDATPTHAWFNVDLDNPDPQGAWYVGDRSLYSTNNYMFEMDHDWADANAGGRYLATGRYRDGGWSGQGPSLYAIAPWGEGNPPANCTQLQYTALLQYSTTVEDTGLSAKINDYQHPDQWEGGAWLISDEKSAVIFAGTKATGDYYWYGFINPDNTGPCVYVEDVGQYDVCLTSEGEECGAEYLTGCDGYTSERGWWSSSFVPQIIFYDPANLAAVAAGTMEPYEPQPYASLDLDDDLILQEGVEESTLGTGSQRRHHIGDVAYDRANNLLYILETFADGTKPVVHVWRVD